MWRKRNNYFDEWFQKNNYGLSIFISLTHKIIYILCWIFNHIKNETLDEIKASLENLWQLMIQLSEFSQYSFVFILKRNGQVGASRVRCGESGTPSTIIYTRWSSRCYKLGCDAPMVNTGLGNSLVPSDHKPLPGSIFTKICVAIWHH